MKDQDACTINPNDSETGCNGSSVQSSSCHSDMEMAGEEREAGKGYNPKYEVQLSMTTSDMFPNYHSPESIVTGPQQKRLV